MYVCAYMCGRDKVQEFRLRPKAIIIIILT